MFHENTTTDHTKIKAKVSPPRLDGEKTGLFSTRTPHRPNPISLSLAKLESVKGRTIILSGLDMINGTPILDIKPYIPAYDSMPTATVADWIVSPPRKPHGLKITLTEPQKTLIIKLLKNSTLYKGKQDTFFSLLQEVLELDFRSISRKNKMDKGLTENTHSISLDGILFEIQMNESEISIQSINGMNVTESTDSKSEII